MDDFLATARAEQARHRKQSPHKASQNEHFEAKPDVQKPPCLCRKTATRRADARHTKQAKMHNWLCVYVTKIGKLPSFLSILKFFGASMWGRKCVNLALFSVRLCDQKRQITIIFCQFEIFKCFERGDEFRVVCASL